MKPQRDKRFSSLCLLGFALLLATRTGLPQLRSDQPALVVSLKSLQLDPVAVPGGSTVQGRVELLGPPDPGGQVVKLESSHPQITQMPASVTVLQGTASAETGPVYKATFTISTRYVMENTLVTITARSGAHSLHARLRVERPRVESAHLKAPDICDGDNKGTVTYTLTGPAPPAFKVEAQVRVFRVNSSSGATNVDGETVPIGKTTGSFRIALPLCAAFYPSESCRIMTLVYAPETSPSARAADTRCRQPPN